MSEAATVADPQQLGLAIRTETASGPASTVIALVARGAIASHSTATSDDTWDGPGNEAKLSNDDGEDVYRGMYAWVDDGADVDTKSAYRFPHHFVGSEGAPGDASTKACSAGIGRLNQSSNSNQKWYADRKGIWDHLSHHLRDADMEPPELKADPPPHVLRLARFERETRELSPEARRIELRTNEDGSIGIVGYGTVYDVEYEMRDFLGTYWEQFADGAFTKSLREKADVRLMLNHDGLPLARTKSGTLVVSEDSIGLRYEASSLDPDDPDVQRIAPKLRRGDLAESSIMFRVVRQEWDEDYEHRTILEAELFDVSMVTWPANPYTSVGLRAADLVRQIADADPEEALVAIRSGRAQLSPDDLVRARAFLDTLDARDPDERRDIPATIGVQQAQREIELLKLRSR
ncbi:MAG: HK97 family phage prohead protease [Actinomycetota bacterium]